MRLATKLDLPAILTIYNHAILTTTSVYEYNPHTLEMREAWMDEKIKKDIPVFVATEGDTVTGFASYGPFRAWAGYKYSAEHSVYVHKDFRGRGIATALLERLIESVKQKEIHTLIAGIDADNQVSIGLHKKLGFEEVGHIRQVGFKFDRWLDLCFYQMILDSSFQPRQ